MVAPVNVKGCFAHLIIVANNVNLTLAEVHFLYWTLGGKQIY